VHKIIISMEAVSLGRELCFTYSDGLSEYRDRITLAEVESGSINNFNSLTQIGFSYPDEEPCELSSDPAILLADLIGLQICFSPSHCSNVQIGLEGEVKWKCLKYTSEQRSEGMCHDTTKEEAHSIGHHSAVVAALTMLCATITMRAASYNDLISIAKTYGGSGKSLKPRAISSQLTRNRNCVRLVP
jgi:hypothetical protein